MRESEAQDQAVPEYHRGFFESGKALSRIGTGRVGGKAKGLLVASQVLESRFASESASPIEVGIPRSVVLPTDVFDAFMERNGLWEAALSDLPDERLAHELQRAELPTEILGDLRAVVEEVRRPLAVRSSSLLEDAMFRPFAGVYGTKMTPNDQPDPSSRFRKLVEAVKLVYASTFFTAAKNYVRTTECSIGDEKMAVILQEVVGRRFDQRYYPHLSGVCRSFNFYPFGGSRPEEGVVDLALGLGKTIVDGGVAFTYSPARPKAPPPFASARDVLKRSQRRFWAVNMGPAPPFDPIAEAEYLVEGGLAEAEYDGTLPHLASTFVAESDCMSPGIGCPGPRAITFAPLLVHEVFPLNRMLRGLMEAFEETLEAEVEIEFAMSFPAPGERAPARLGFLQVRPMVVSREQVEIGESELERPDVLVASDLVMGNGILETLRDVVYVKPATFETRHTQAIAGQLEGVNAALFEQGRPYVLIGFGRWGSSDPWLGIPVDWGQICGAKVIVEATLPERMVEASQGSHFFHNLSSFEVSYLSIPHQGEPGVDWAWLDAQPAERETEHVRHVRLERPLLVKVDGRAGRGAIWRGGETT